jgi:hypothetical protein
LADHADAVVCYAVVQQDPVAVGVVGADNPAAEEDAVGNADKEVFAVASGVREGGVAFADYVGREVPTARPRLPWLARAAQSGECATKTKTATDGCRFRAFPSLRLAEEAIALLRVDGGLRFNEAGTGGYLLERANWLPSGSLKTLEVPQDSVLGSTANWTPLDLRILAVAKTSSDQKAMD